MELLLMIVLVVGLLALAPGAPQPAQPQIIVVTQEAPLETGGGGLLPLLVLGAALLLALALGV